LKKGSLKEPFNILMDRNIEGFDIYFPWRRKNVN
jgi:hypothetical protein